MDMGIITVGITCANDLEAQAAKISFEANSWMFQNPIFKFVIIKVPSTQPLIGSQAITDSCSKQLINTLQTFNSTGYVADVIVSIQGGIISENQINEPKSDQWYDTTFIKVYFPKSKKRISGYTKLLHLPAPYIEEAKKRELRKCDIGSIIARFNPGASAYDPHLVLTRVSKSVYLQQTISQLIATNSH